LRAQLLAVTPEHDEATRQEVFGELYVGLHSLTEDAERASLKAVHQLASATMKLVRKVLEKPSAFTPSVFNAIGMAIQLLESLASGNADVDPVMDGVRMLVVDDDAFSRRAIANAVQLQFGKPKTADSGERAIELAAGKAFDVIFLDVLMPGIDGFAACAKIRETSENSSTPIVFITSLSDTASREKALSCGGSGFITKPVLPAEVSLQALTFVFRNRLEGCLLVNT
jgi:CheY-like chemotaxis protein